MRKYVCLAKDESKNKSDANDIIVLKSDGEVT